MLRRYYLVPLRQDLTEPALDHATRVLAGAHDHIPGLVQCAVGLDERDGRRILLWAATFAGQQEFRGIYMRHRYHTTVLDSLLHKESPERIADLDTASCGFDLPDNGYEPDGGFRRLLLFRTTRPERLATLAAGTPGLRASYFAAETVSAQTAIGTVDGETWTHVWEQTFESREAFLAWLAGDSSAASAERSGWTDAALGIEAHTSYEFDLTVSQPDETHELDLIGADATIVVQHEVAPGDASEMVRLLETLYDAAALDAGMELASRWQTSAALGEPVTIQSTWSLGDEDRWHEIRALLLRDPRWQEFVAAAARISLRGRRFLAFPIGAR